MTSEASVGDFTVFLNEEFHEIKWNKFRPKNKSCGKWRLPNRGFRTSFLSFPDSRKIIVSIPDTQNRKSIENFPEILSVLKVRKKYSRILLVLRRKLLGPRIPETKIADSKRKKDWIPEVSYPHLPINTSSILIYLKKTRLFKMEEGE